MMLDSRSTAALGHAGFALPFVLFTLMVSSAVVAAMMWLLVAQVRLDSAGIQTLKVRLKAETDLTTSIALADVNVLANLPLDTLGGLLTFDRSFEIRRVGENLFLAGAMAVGAAAEARALRLFKVEADSAKIDRAVASLDSVLVGPDVRFSASDSLAACGSVVSGPVNDSTQVDSLQSFAVWEGRATKVMAPPLVAMTPGPVLRADGSCDRALDQNWGDPAGVWLPCGLYLPVIWVLGDLTLTGGAGQGVLLVDGDLHVAGGFRFHGLILVRGAIHTAGAGLELVGAMQIAGGSAGGSSLMGRDSYAFSPCAVGRANLPFGRVVPVREHGWLQLY